MQNMTESPGKSTDVTMSYREYDALRSKAEAYDNILNQIRPVDYATRPEATWPVSTT